MASIRKLPSGRYRVRWREADGRERGATSPTKKAALELKAKAELEAFRGRTFDPSSGRVAFGDYFTEVMTEADDLRPSTRALYESVGRRYLMPTLGPTRLSAIDARSLGRLYADLRKKGVGIPTVEVVHRLTSRVLRQAAREGLIQASPASMVRSPRARREPPRLLTMLELGRLIFVLDRLSFLQSQGITESSISGTPEDRRRSLREGLAAVESQGDARDLLRNVCGVSPQALRGSSPQHGTMALLGAFAGLRFGEVAALRRPSFDITSDAPIVHVGEALTEVSGVVSIGPPKTASSMRAVPIVGAPAARIYETVAAAEDDDLLFRSPKGGPISPTRWRARVWRRAVSFLEMKPSPTFHDLRHTYAAFLIEDGRHPKEIQELMGHASSRTSLDVYGHLMEGVTHDRLAGLAARFGA